MGLCRTVWNRVGLCETTLWDFAGLWHCERLCGTALDCVGLHGTVYIGLCETVWDCVGLSGLSYSVWNHERLRKTVKVCVELCGTVKDRIGRCRTV